MSPRPVALMLLALLASSCTDGGAGASPITCNVFGREAAGETLGGERVTLHFPRDAAVVEIGGATVRLMTATEEGTAGSLAVIVLDHEERELARGLYQLGDETRNQFVGGHGFTGLVVWRDPTTGAEIQFYCSSGEPAPAQ